MSSSGTSLRFRVLRSAKWTLLGHGASQVLRFGSNLILTRLLAPDMFGVMALGYMMFTGLGMLSDLATADIVTRSPRGVQLTKLGEKLNGHARTILNEIEMLRGNLRGAPSEPEGTVVIGLAPTIGTIITASVLEAITEKLPRVRVQIRESMSRDLPDLIRWVLGRARAGRRIVWSCCVTNWLCLNRCLHRQATRCRWSVTPMVPPLP